LTQKWVNGSATNYGVILWATNENTDGKDLRFHSSEYTIFQNLWPKLEITYSTETKTVYFLKDHLGSVRATVLDSVGATVIGYDDYDPWGYPLAQRTKAIPTVYLQGASKNKFTGHEYDDDFGLNWVDTDHRPYMPDIGRWAVRDPLADIRPEESPYSYAGNNPVVRIDPLGLYWVDTNGDGIADTWVIEEPIVVEVLPFYPTSDPGTDAIRSPMIEVDDLLGSKAIAKGLAKAGSIAITAAMIKKATMEATEQTVSRITQFAKLFKGKKFAKALRNASRTKPLTQAEADEVIEIAKSEGLKIRIDANDLKGDHFVGGPHIHIEELHIRVERDVVVKP